MADGSGQHRPCGPLQFRSRRSPLHALGPGWKLLAATAIATLALALGSLPLLVALLASVAAGYAAAGLSAAELWRDLRWLLLQAVGVVALTVGLRGLPAFTAGCRTALQLVLVFLPIALVLRTTRTEAVLELLRAWLPERMRFAFAASLRLLPVFARELGELVEMQRLRGARLARRDLWRPRAWRDWLACVALPMTVRVIEVAGEAADAATLRGVGLQGIDTGAPIAAAPEEESG